uniref:ARAD1D48334p n=1 Tax=Blastobotrys adeninivorans TaxID=409370 RepID=A0A060TDJ9_BLAAD
MAEDGRYIVRFKASATDDEYKKTIEGIKAAGGKVTHEYTLFKGFAAYLPQGHLTTLSTHPAVDEVENDQQVHTQ